MTPPARTIFNFTWSNDALNVMVPAADLERDRTFHDDDGFTNDFAAWVALVRGPHQYSLDVRQRMITERGG